MKIYIENIEIIFSIRDILIHSPVSPDVNMIVKQLSTTWEPDTTIRTHEDSSNMTQ